MIFHAVRVMKISLRMNALLWISRLYVKRCLNSVLKCRDIVLDIMSVLELHVYTNRDLNDGIYSVISTAIYSYKYVFNMNTDDLLPQAFIEKYLILNK